MTETLHEISDCEVCGNRVLVPVLDLGLHPMCDDLIRNGDSRVCEEYPIEILYCEDCCTAHQRFQIPKRVLFPREYHYRARFTGDVLKGMESLVASYVEKFGSLSGKTVLDIGCNDGSLLGFFRNHGAITIGVEPTGAASDAEGKGHCIVNDYFTEALAEELLIEHGKPDVITFTNVFAHIEDLRGLIRALAKLVGKNTVLVIENHYLGSVLSGMQFDTFYHEHPRTYSLNSFAIISRKLGMDLINCEFPSRYGGNIRVFIADATSKHAGIGGNLTARLEQEKEFSRLFSAQRNNILRWHNKKSSVIYKLVSQYGKLRAKAFPGRAAILVKLLGLDETSISAVYEKPGSLKLGNYIPGTKIPIFSDTDLFAESNKDLPILNFAWHIADEIAVYLRDAGYKGEIVNILERSDFVEHE